MKSVIKKIFLLSVTLIFLYFVCRNLDLNELYEVLKNFNVWFVFLVCLSMLCSFTCRSICFKLLMSKTQRLPLKELIPLCLTGASLNVLLPARAGDIFRAFYIGHKYNIRKLKVFGTVMLERMFDTMVIFVFLLIAITFYHRNELAQHLCIFAGIAMLLFAAFAFVAYKFNKTDQICSFMINKTEKIPFAEQLHKLINFINKSINSFCDGFEIMDAPAKMLGVIAASFGIWFFECLNFYIILSGFGYHIHWSVTLFVICFIALACMIPSTSIFIGPYQMAVIAAFAIYDVAKEPALAITLIQQTIVLVFTSIIAAVFLLKNNISWTEIKNKIKNNEE